MNERILLPLDGSRVGEAALPYVDDLISKMAPGVKVEITLLQVVSPLTHYVVAGAAGVAVPYTEEEMKVLRQKALDYLGKAGEVLKSRGANVKTMVAVGDAADSIMKAADEIGADLIAMSTHGRSGISRWAFGSVTDRVLRWGNRPVLLVRAPKETK
ncbi:MAG: universal stress protein [Chloroflexi bacterium]|nr:universal stress protein [Chloroflexota bacterium]